MINRLLIQFNRSSSISKPDLGERVGNFTLGLLRTGLGKVFTVTKIKSYSFSENIHSTAHKIAAIALFILAFPITLSLAAIGFIGVAVSKSHKELFNQLNDSQKPAHTSRHIAFNPDVRGRPFKRHEAPKAVSEVTSIVAPLHQPQTRTYPPISIIDTVVYSRSGNIQSAHGQTEFFKDDEILDKADITRSVSLGSDVYAHYTKHKKAIIQQQATGGCTAAVTAMLIVDKDKKPNLTALQNRDLGDDSDMEFDLTNAGLIPIVSSAQNLTQLKALIAPDNRSAIVHMQGDTLGAHVVIVDAIASDLSSIRLRDPYHGWEITVSKQAFERQWTPGDVIQVL